jgi:Skp family chaperone for outer membrane proteins
MLRLLFLFAIVFCAFCANPVRAAEEKGPSTIVAIVDVQRVLQESVAAKSVQSQIEAHRSKFQAEISKEEAELRGAEKKLAKMREMAQADAYAQAEEKLRARFLSVERHVQGRRKALDQAYTEAMNKVREGLVEVVQKAALARGVNLVMVKQQVIWHDKAVDLTDIVLKNLNKEIPGIKIAISEGDGPVGEE